jgi:hypothetical protein
MEDLWLRLRRRWQGASRNTTHGWFGDAIDGMAEESILA